MRRPTALRHRSVTLLGLTLVAAVLWLAAAPDAQARGGARRYRFDGFRLGDDYARLMKRAPYSQPCDNDPIDKRARRAMVYGALPCGGHTFPEQTSVLLYLRMNAPGQPKYAQPIEAIIWLHGQYFRKRSTFPIHPGDPLAKARRIFGAPVGTLQLRGKRIPALTVHRFRGDVAVLTEGTLVRGVAVGALPRDPDSEQWRAILQMLRRYTPLSGLPPATPAGLTGACAAAWRRVVACRNESRFARKMSVLGDRFARKCARRIGEAEGKAQVLCIARSRTCGAIDVCIRR